MGITHVFGNSPQIGKDDLQKSVDSRRDIQLLGLLAWSYIMQLSIVQFIKAKQVTGVF